MLTETLVDSRPPGVYDCGAHFPSDAVVELSQQFGRGLAERGVQPGDTVVFQLPPCLEAIVAFHGCWLIGAIAAPLHHRFTARELGALLHRLAPKVSLFQAEQVREILSTGSIEMANVGPTDPAVILATSGTSGAAKLVVHSHGALAYKGSVMVAVHGLTSDDVVLMPAPMAHISGLLSGVLVPGVAGMEVAVMRRWHAESALELIRSRHVTFMAGPPVYFSQMSRAPSFSGNTVSSLRLISCGGTDVTTEFARRHSKVFDAVVKRTYGSTEAPTVSTAHAGDPPDKGWTTDGRATGRFEMQVDPASEELLVRGAELFMGYLDQAGIRAGVDYEGWFHTGDRARIDDGWLSILGRLRDVIIRGGENVDAREVELVCQQLEGIEQVVVLGYPDNDMGERVGAVIVGNRPFDAQVIQDYCSASGLARFKIPERVIQVDEVPLLSFGKPDKVALRQLFTVR